MSTTPLVQVKKLTENAKLPTRAHDTDSGADLYSSEEVLIPAKSRKTLNTGIALSIPYGYDFIVKDKSGLASKNGLTVLGGVIDQGYTGEVKVVLFNTSDEDYLVESDQKIAQIVCRPIVYPKFFEVENLVNTDGEGNGTTRSDSGFGSTGLE